MTRLSPAERLRIALDLYEFGESMMRQNLRRRHPSASADEIEALLNKWLHDRPLLWARASDLAPQLGAGGRGFNRNKDLIADLEEVQRGSLTPP